MREERLGPGSGLFVVCATAEEAAARTSRDSNGRHIRLPLYNKRLLWLKPRGGASHRRRGWLLSAHERLATYSYNPRRADPGLLPTERLFRKAIRAPPGQGGSTTRGST